MFFRKIRSPPQTLHAHRRVTDTLWVYDRGALLEQSAGRDEVDESLLRSGTHPAGQLAPLSGCGLKGPAEPGAMRHCPQPRRCRNTLSPSCEIVCRGLIEVCPISEHCNICPGDDPTPLPARLYGGACRGLPKSRQLRLAGSVGVCGLLADGHPDPQTHSEAIPSHVPSSDVGWRKVSSS